MTPVVVGQFRKNGIFEKIEHRQNQNEMVSGHNLAYFLKCCKFSTLLAFGNDIFYTDLGLGTHWWLRTSTMHDGPRNSFFDRWKVFRP